MKVQEEYDADRDKVGDLTSAGVRNHFYRGMNEPVLKQVFHVLNQDVDISEILNSAASSLYCTLFSNMCAYILQHRVKLDGRTAADDEVIFRNFRDLAREEAFKDITTEDIPLPPHGTYHPPNGIPDFACAFRSRLIWSSPRGQCCVYGGKP
jgi:hypothetical protein